MLKLMNESGSVHRLLLAEAQAYCRNVIRLPGPAVFPSLPSSSAEALAKAEAFGEGKV
jgi:hypothetical protein